MAVKWIVPGPNAKVLAQAVHCLAKLGEELYIDGRPTKLVLRTVNMAKTAFASFTLHPDFFSFYPTITSDEGACCEVSMKAVLCVLRVPSAMDKAVESCAICCCPEKVQIILKYKLGFVKTNSIQLLQAETLTARYEEETLPSCVVMDPKLLSERLSSFNSPEITWAITRDGVQFRNFSDLIEDTGGLRSEVRVDKDELLELVVCEEAGAELTFCLAELRTILTFAEHMGAPIKCSFTATGMPLYFIVSNQVITAHVVLSTLGISNTQSTASSQPVRDNQNISRPIPNDASVLQANRNGRNSSQQIMNDVTALEPDQQPSNSQRIELNEPQLSEPQAYVPGENTQRCTSRLRHVLIRQMSDVTQLPGYDDVLAPDSDEDL